MSLRRNDLCVRLTLLAAGWPWAALAVGPRVAAAAPNDAAQATLASYHHGATETATLDDRRPIASGERSRPDSTTTPAGVRTPCSRTKPLFADCDRERVSAHHNHPKDAWLCRLLV